MSESPPQTLYQHEAHPHAPRNVNEQHAAERTDLNSRIAVWLTAYVGTMWTAYGFAALAIVGLLGVLAILNPTVYTFIAWLSQTFIQLVLLPVIMVGQNVLNRHSELAQDEAFHNIVRLLHEQDQHRRHLDAQDTELLAHRRLLVGLLGTSPTSASVAPALPDGPPMEPDGRLPSLPRDAKGRFLPRK